MTNKLTGGLLLSALLLTAACDGPRHAETLQPEGDISRIVLQIDDGSVGLVKGPALQVERTIRGAEGAVELSHRIESVTPGEDVLYLTARCATLLPCRVDTHITVPEGIPVDVELSRGELWATGLDALTLEVDRGEVDVNIDGPLSARIGVGSIIAGLPASAAARIAVGRGDITMQVPPGDWSLDVSAAHLVVDELISPTEDASGALELVAPSGTVTVNSSQALAGVR